MFDHPHDKEIFPNVQSEPPLTQVSAIPCHTIICYQGEEVGTPFSISSPQEVLESNEVSLLSLLFFQLAYPGVLSLSSLGHTFKHFYQLCYLPLVAFKLDYVHLLLVQNICTHQEIMSALLRLFRIILPPTFLSHTGKLLK